MVWKQFVQRSRHEALLALACLALAATWPSRAQAPEPDIKIARIADEAEAVMNIVVSANWNGVISDAQLQFLRHSEGYKGLRQREALEGRTLSDTAFQSYILSLASLTRAAEIDEGIQRFKPEALRSAAMQALAYLPAGTPIHTKAFLVVKPVANSFVSCLDTDPEVFINLDPRENTGALKNKLVHEFHHIGYAAACSSPSAHQALAVLPARTQEALHWLTAFGEGLAMLAAAGGPDVHPCASATARERARWDEDMADFNANLRKIEGFLVHVMDGTFTSAQDVRREANVLYGTRGPWYTVGWKMAATIEKVYGRDRLIRAFCDPRDLLRTFNEAAVSWNAAHTDHLATWSPELLDTLGGLGRAPGSQASP